MLGAPRNSVTALSHGFRRILEHPRDARGKVCLARKRRESRTEKRLWSCNGQPMASLKICRTLFPISLSNGMEHEKATCGRPGESCARGARGPSQGLRFFQNNSHLQEGKDHEETRVRSRGAA